MPRTIQPPAYRLHAPSGKAVVTLNGRDHYLGLHGSKESRAAYDELVARWLASGRSLPSDESATLTVAELILRYYRHCESFYANRRTRAGILAHIKSAMKPLKRLFGSTAAGTFGPKSILTVRESLIAEGVTRNQGDHSVIERLSRKTVSPRQAELSQLAERFAQAITGGQVEAIARELGVSSESLRAIGVGFDGANTCFPERDQSGHVTAINARLANGEKRVGAGQHRGLIIPTNLGELPDPVLIPEGPSDTAALLTMGLTAVGRPMAKGGAAQLAELLVGREVLVVGENDEAGIDGAKHIAARLAAAWNISCTWAVPPRTAKDAREYLIAHANENPAAVGRELLAHLRAHQQVEEPGNAEPAIPAWHTFPTDALPEPLRKSVSGNGKQVLLLGGGGRSHRRVLHGHVGWEARPNSANQVVRALS